MMYVIVQQLCWWRLLILQNIFNYKNTFTYILNQYKGLSDARTIFLLAILYHKFIYIRLVLCVQSYINVICVYCMCTYGSFVCSLV